MRHILKKGLLSVPDLMGCFRLITIPVSVWLYLRAFTDADYYRATIIMSISSITDMFDGMIARKFNMIMGFGKSLDPLADELIHGTILLCLWSRYPPILLPLVLFVLKEGLILITGAIKLWEGKKLSGAKWLGRYCTTLLFAMFFLPLFFPHMSSITVNVLVLLCVAAMFITLFLYIPAFRNM